MDFNKILNQVTSSIGKEVGKVTQNIPLEYVYIGYLVRKGLTMENANRDGKLVRDLFLYTYIDLEPTIVVLMEDGLYKNMQTSEKYPKLEYASLVSKHLASGETVDMSAYPNYSKNQNIGIFNLIRFEDIVNKVIDAELNSKEVNLKLSTKLKKTYTPVELNGILNRYQGKKESNSLVKTFTVPPVLIDELDSIRTVFSLESKFLYEYYGKTDQEIYDDLKQKSMEYVSIKN